MERDGLINNTCATICEIKAELARIQETIAGLYTSLNGLQGDGSGNLQIMGGPGVNVETIDGNKVRLTAGIIDTDPEPTEGSTAPVQSGGTYEMIMTEYAARVAADSAETTARIAADNSLGNRIDNVGTAANPVARATTAALADAVPASGVTGVLPIDHGGTGSGTKNFVDLSTAQTIGGIKTRTARTDLRSPAPYTELLRIHSDTIDIRSNTNEQGEVFADIRDQNNILICRLMANITVAPGYTRLITQVHNSDGTDQFVQLARGA